MGRLGRSSSAAGVRQVGGGDVQRQSSLPAREALNQVNALYYIHQALKLPFLLPSSQVDLRVNINIVLIITSPTARDTAPADLFLAGRYAH